MDLRDSTTSVNLKISNHGRNLKDQLSAEYSTEVTMGVGDNSDENVVQKPQTLERDLAVEEALSCTLLDQTDLPCKSSSCYTVTCTITIAIAIPKGEEEEPNTTVEKAKKKPTRIVSTGVVEIPKAQGYYHIEYNLLPDDPEPTKVDVVMFGLAAKIYMENETKVLKPWQDGDQVWFGWSQSVNLNVTRELLVKMASHKMTFRVWNTRDRVSAKARHDRPMAIRLPQVRGGEDLDHAGGIKNMVHKLRQMFEKENLKSNTPTKMRRDSVPTDTMKLSETHCAAAGHKSSTVDIQENEKCPSSMALNVRSSVTYGEQLAHQRGPLWAAEQSSHFADTKSTKPDATQDQEQSKPEQKRSVMPQISKDPKDMSTSTICPVKSSSVKDKSLVSKKKPAQKPTQENSELTDSIQKSGVASLELSLISLLAGAKSLTDCLVTTSGGVYEGFCNITLDVPIISEQLKTELNPLVIRVLSASSLPSSPIPFHKLKERCLPVYCQYKFHNMPVHRTKGKEHGANVDFKDVNVILTALLSPVELLEFLRGPFLKIEVHDRDRKVEEAHASPAIFGTDPYDDKLANAVLISTIHSISNPFVERVQPNDPYGVAKLNLSDLLEGQTSLTLNLPIRCSPPKQFLGDGKRAFEKKPRENPMPMGHYIDANSQLKVQVELACPLNFERERQDCPFGRIIFLFPYNNIPFLTRLKCEIQRVNTAAFQLDSYSVGTAERALSDYKMSAKEKENKHLDVLTGFHMFDTHLHVFVLEGLKEYGVKRLWENVPKGLDEDGREQVTIRYNSSLSFSKRLYDTLDVGLSPVQLHEPLATIMKQPLVCIRDVVPYICFQAMTRISQLCQAKKLKDIVQNNLFPSAEMVLSLNKEFGIVPEQLVEESKVSVDTSCQPATDKTHSPPHTLNRDYSALKPLHLNHQLHRQSKDFIEANIEDVHRASRMIKRPAPAVIVATVAEGQAAHNYSIQTMNTTTKAMELLRREMAKEPSRRFTYSQQYQSATVDPCDLATEQKATKARSRAAWRTYDGFIYPGFRSSSESNKHPKQPDEATTEELRKPWRENILHGNILRPTLSRSTLPWAQRHQDFELYAQPPEIFPPRPPVTIHLAGEALRQEQRQAAHAQYGRWLRKMLPDEGGQGQSYTPRFRCHMKRTNLNKLEDILKDKPMKFSLRRPGMVLKPIPVLSAIRDDGVSSAEKLKREPCVPFAPGPFQNHSLSWDINIIPRHLPQYRKFHFRGFWRPHLFEYKRTAMPLRDEERRVHFLQKPAVRSQMAAVLPQRNQNITETRTQDKVILNVH